MKYGLFLSLVAILLVVFAISAGGWFYWLGLPALSLSIVGGAYLCHSTFVFGKRQDGTLSIVSLVMLFPYLLCVWSTWYVLRLVSREPAYDTPAAGVLIGRRLLPRELPPEVRVVVDLTCEFAEPRAVRDAARYISWPILGGSSPDPQELAKLVRGLAAMKETVFIHCVQGHGRTGLIAALLLLASDRTLTVNGAVDAVKRARPLVKLNRTQMAALQSAARMLQV